MWREETFHVTDVFHPVKPYLIANESIGFFWSSVAF